MALIPLSISEKKVNADNNQHSKNENMRLANYFDGIKSLTYILTQPWK